jgi:hypothetical protein
MGGRILSIRPIAKPAAGMRDGAIRCCQGFPEFNRIDSHGRE